MADVPPVVCLEKFFGLRGGSLGNDNIWNSLPVHLS